MLMFICNKVDKKFNPVLFYELIWPDLSIEMIFVFFE